MDTRYDERNIIFSRARLKKNTEAYRAYYQKHPEIKDADDAARGMNITDNLRASPQFKSLFFPLTASNGHFLKTLHDMVDETKIKPKISELPKNFHQNIKAITKHYGAKEVGIVKLNDAHYYSHFGGTNTTLGLRNYGQKIQAHYTHAIVYLIDMDKTYINRAPHFEELLETENVYVKIAITGARLAQYIKALGYDAMFQSEAFYLTPLVPLAYDAGLGQIGMANHIVNPIYGDRIRLGAVLTTLPLQPDQPIDFGLDAFCKRCALCLMNCPSKSIKPHKRIVNNRPFYKFDDISCFALWKRTGTDCGTCIQSCPFSQGIDQATIDKMKNEPEIIDQVIQAHIKKHTRRQFTKDPLDIVKLGESK